jgi:hypothetical protein
MHPACTTHLHCLTTLPCSAPTAPRRTSAPAYRIVVTNRLSRQNLLQDISDSLEVQVKEGVLMFRDASRADVPIHGIWFHDVAERKAFSKVLSKLLKEPKEGGFGGAAAAAAGAGPAAAERAVSPGRALLSMLKGAPSSGPSASASGATSSPQALAQPRQTAPVDKQHLAPAAAALFSAAAAALPAGAAAAPATGSPLMGGSSVPQLNALLGIKPSAGGRGASAAAPQSPAGGAPGGRPAGLASSGSAAAAPAAPATAGTRSAIGSGGADGGVGMVLTRRQLAQALTELLQDEDFIKIIHTKYLEGVTRAAARA